MFQRKFLQRLGLLLTPLFGATVLTGCGGDGGDDNNVPGSSVVSIDTDTNPIPVGQAGILSVNFSYSANDVFDDGVNVVVVVHLPSNLRYRADTSEVDLPFGDDRQVGAQVTECGANGQFLLFDLDKSDLEAADNPGGDADARLTLTVDAVQATPTATVQAIAHDETVPFDCNGFVPDAVLGIAVP